MLFRSKLKRLCGGFASVFPGTSTVESDFSVIGWEKNEYQAALTDFSLEGNLQCKQYEAGLEKTTFFGNSKSGLFF